MMSNEPPLLVPPEGPGRRRSAMARSKDRKRSSGRAGMAFRKKPQKNQGLNLQSAKSFDRWDDDSGHALVPQHLVERGEVRLDQFFEARLLGR